MGRSVPVLPGPVLAILPAARSTLISPLVICSTESMHDTKLNCIAFERAVMMGGSCIVGSQGPVKRARKMTIQMCAPTKLAY